MRRRDREMSADFAKQVFDDCMFATVSMLDESGNAYGIPVSIARMDDSLYFHAAKLGKKHDSLKLHPKVSVSAVSWIRPVPNKFTTEYASAVCQGTAQEITEDSEKIAALRTICEKYTPDNMHDFDNAIARSLSVTAIWKISIDTITGKRKKYDRSGNEMTYERME